MHYLTHVRSFGISNIHSFVISMSISIAKLSLPFNCEALLHLFGSVDSSKVFDKHGRFLPHPQQNVEPNLLIT